MKIWEKVKWVEDEHGKAVLECQQIRATLIVNFGSDKREPRILDEDDIQKGTEYMLEKVLKYLARNNLT